MKEVQLILRPDFYQVVQGDKWYQPGTANPNVKSTELVVDTFDPAKFVGNDFSDLTPEEIAAVQKYRAEQAAAKRKQNARPTPNARSSGGSRSAGGRSGGGANGGGGNGGRRQRGGSNGGGKGGGQGGGGGFLVADPGATGGGGRQLRQLTLAPTPSDDGQAAAPPPPGAVPGMPAPAGPVAVTGAPLPTGSFDPSTTPDFTVWAHDDTVLPGHTYHYRLRYVVTSPVYGTSSCATRSPWWPCSPSPVGRALGPSR